MIQTVTIVAKSNPPKLGPRREGFNDGLRSGIFDRCNGYNAKGLDRFPRNPYSRGWINGYLTGYHSNERRI